MLIRYLFILLLVAPLAAAAADADLVRKPSAHGVQDTMDRLQSQVEDRGMTVFARIDHRANAESVGKSMPDSQVLLFGEPKAGTRIMLHDLAAGLDLPLRVLVYTDYDGGTWVVYHNPQSLKQLYGVEDCKMLDHVEQALDAITAAATQ